MDLAGAHIVVTGASQGIGEALTRELTARGAMVTMVSRNKEALDRVADETGARAWPADLSRPGDLEALAAGIEREVAPVDVLVNNAALGGVGEFATMSTQYVVDHVNTNLMAPIELTHRLLAGMIDRGHGTIVLVSSAGAEIAMRNACAYGATKAGLSMFGQILHRELRDSPVNVLLVTLGEVETPLLVGVRADPVMAVANKRFGQLPSLTPQKVARYLTDAIERDRSQLIRPRALAPLVGMRALPSRLMDLAMRGA